MQAIAIVGMACRYPDACSPQELWENALAQRRAFRAIPDQRLNRKDYYHPDRAAADRTYSAYGAFLTDYKFDREHFRISGKTFRSTDLTHWLALDMAEKAFLDAGLLQEDALPRESTAVIVGNTLTGEFSRAQALRLRWPYVARVVTQELLHESWQPDAIQHFLGRLEREYKRPFAPVNEETLAGSLSNTIAGRICNYFNLKGGGYTVDGACSSSLLSLAHACRSLDAGDVDVALAGGVDLSIDPFEIIGFAKTSALASEEMRVYDLHSHGFLPGEGCGFVVLMRYEDALAQGRHIYALVRGWGISSDGSGGITRPEVQGQHLAVLRAYQRSGIEVDAVPYIEGHGTGTEVGDATELKAVTFTWQQFPHFVPDKQTAISTIKANIGHTKAAAGIAGVIKATQALANQIIPPTTGMIEPHPELLSPDARLRVLRRAEIWPADAPLVTGVSSMGFGGINVHLVLEGVAQRRSEHFTELEQKLLTTSQDAEVFLLGADNEQDLLTLIEKLLALAPRLSYAELTDLAAHLSCILRPSPLRAALIASKPQELESSLRQLQELVRSGTSTHIDSRSHIYLSRGSSTPRIAFLFPGQGSPAYLNGGMFRLCFPEIDTLYRAASLPEHADGRRTEIAQPAIALASLAGLRVMEKLGIRAQLAIGHSLGELSALHWAGVIDDRALLRIAAARGEAMAQVKSQHGTMLGVKASAQVVSELIGKDPIVIAGLNAPNQTVVAGEVLAIHRFAARAYAKGIASAPLAVSHAFHSPLVASAVPTLSMHLDRENFSAPRRPLLSTVTGNFVTEGDDVKDLLCQQVTSPVRFLEAVEHINEDIDLFIEVGPGHTLQRLVQDITGKPAIATDAASPSMRGILAALAATFVLGANPDTSAIFAHRFTRPIDLAWNPSFLANPCEQAPLMGVERVEETFDVPDELDEHGESAIVSGGEGNTLALVQKIIATRTEMPLDLLVPENRMLSDLHLNSLSVGEIFADACRVLHIPQAGPLLQHVDASLGEIVQRLEDLQQQTNSSEEQECTNVLEGLATWIRCFALTYQEQPLTARLAQGQSGNWRIIAPPDYALTDELRQAFALVQGTGSVVVLPEAAQNLCVDLLLQASASLQAQKEATHLVVVQHGSLGAAFVRSLYLEYPHLTVCIVHLPADLPVAVECIVDEARAARGFVEVNYDVCRKRSIPVLGLYALSSQGQKISFASRDVLLVTGGGKGIAAECALALAQETGITLALLGRSLPQQDAVLRDHLAKVEAAGVRYRYFPVDILNADAVKEVVQEIEIELGPVSAIVHGAGTNRPTLLSMLDEQLIDETIAPKVHGLRNILAAISPQKLKSLTTFGSVIARTGMQGEAHYALANEWMAHVTAEFERENPHVSCLCIEWSVWSEMGMGERLGRVDALRAQDITPIPPHVGLQFFRQLLSQHQGTSRLVVSGRLGDAPTVKLDTRQLPFLRFLEKPLVFYPGIELIVEAEVSSSTDSYVQEHQVQGEQILPAVIGLEAMAQAAQAVTGCSERPSFDDVQFLRPLVVPFQDALTLRIMTLVHYDGKVEIAIRSSETRYQVNHFQAFCHFSGQGENLIAMLEPCETQDEVAHLPKPEDLYGGILFHRGRFRRLQGYSHLHAWECIAQITTAVSAGWFARYLPQQLVLGDPASRDAFIHAIQACIPQATLLPVGVDAIRFSQRRVEENQQIQVHARERSHEGNTFTYDVEARDHYGNLLEQWIGLRLHLIGASMPPEQWAGALFGPYFERRLADMSAGVSPLLTTHIENASVIVDACNASQFTCVTQEIESRPHQQWRELLSAREYDQAQSICAQSGEEFNRIATRMLAVRKALSGVDRDAAISFVCSELDGWQVWAAGPLQIITCIVPVQAHDRLAAFAFLLQQITDAQRASLAYETGRK